MKLSHCSLDTSNSETPGQMEMIYIREIRECTLYNGHTFTHSIIALFIHFHFITSTSYHLYYSMWWWSSVTKRKTNCIVRIKMKWHDTHTYFSMSHLLTVCIVSCTYVHMCDWFLYAQAMRWNEVKPKWNGTSCQYCLLSFVEVAFPLFPVSYKCEQMCQIVQYLEVQLVLLLPLQSAQAQFHLLSMCSCMCWDWNERNEECYRRMSLHPYMVSFYFSLALSSSFSRRRKKNEKRKFPIHFLYYFLLFILRRNK